MTKNVYQWRNVGGGGGRHFVDSPRALGEEAPEECFCLLISTIKGCDNLFFACQRYKGCDDLFLVVSHGRPHIKDGPQKSR